MSCSYKAGVGYTVGDSAPSSVWVLECPHPLHVLQPCQNVGRKQGLEPCRPVLQASSQDVIHTIHSCHVHTCHDSWPSRCRTAMHRASLSPSTCPLCTGPRWSLVCFELMSLELADVDSCLARLPLTTVNCTAFGPLAVCFACVITDHPEYGSAMLAVELGECRLPQSSAQYCQTSMMCC
jgi:hypothetical protein